MPATLDSSVTRLLLSILVLLIVLYLSPFFLSPVIKIVVSLWGFFLGKRKRSEVLAIYAPPQNASPNPPSTAAPNPTQAAADAAFTRVAESEFKVLEDGMKKQNDQLKLEVDELQKKIGEIEKRFTDSRSKAKDGLVRKAFDKTSERISEDTGKNILLLIVVAALLLFDTIIARQIFRSFGVGVEVLTLKEIQIEHAWIFGLFTTLVAALVLHIFWERGKFKEFLKGRYSWVIGAALILAIFLIRLFTFTTNPDVAKTLVEALMIVLWLGGVLAVYWLLGEITGDNNNWFNVLVALFAPVLLVLLFLFGGVLLVEFVIHWIVSHVIESWFALRAARKKQIIHNNEVNFNAQKSGFYRGLTL